MAGFVEINIERDKDKHKLKLFQMGIIERFLLAVDMDSCNSKYTPFEKDLLCKDEKGEPCI